MRDNFADKRPIIAVAMKKGMYVTISMLLEC